MIEEQLLDQAVDFEAGSLPDSAAAPMSFEHFVSMALDDPDPEIDPAASVLLCSKDQFRDAAAKATEEVADALRAVTAELLEYFPLSDLICFRLFSPADHEAVEKKYSHLKGRQKEAAVTEELKEHVEALAQRYCKDQQDSFEGRHGAAAHEQVLDDFAAARLAPAHAASFQRVSQQDRGRHCH